MDEYLRSFHISFNTYIGRRNLHGKLDPIQIRNIVAAWLKQTHRINRAGFPSQYLSVSVERRRKNVRMIFNNSIWKCLSLAVNAECNDDWLLFANISEGSYIQISPFPFTTLVFTTVWYLHPHVESKWSTKAIKHTSSHRQHLQLFIISMGVITSPKSPFNCRDSILKDQICCQLTFRGCFLQCEATCLHASHAQNSVVDPVHVGGHLCVDVKRFVLKSTINIKSGEIKATLTQLLEPPRLTMPARIPSTVKAPPLSPWGI